MYGLKKWFFLLAAVVSAANVWGQAAPSPFTTYGLGEPYGTGLIHNQGNGLGVAQPQYWFINNQNPALLVFNTLSVFQFGVVGESRSIKSDTANEKSRGGNLNYITMAFPIKPGRIATSVGMMPYTNVDYRVQYFGYATDPLGAVVDTLISSESGSGGLTQLYWSNGVRINEDMSVGLKTSFLFGPVSNVYSNVLTTNASQGDPYVVSIEEKKNLRGVNFALGYSFSKDSLGPRNDRRLSFGAVYNIASDLTARLRSESFRMSLAGDTLERYPLSSDRGKVHLPASYTVGVSYGKGSNWSVGAEYFYQDWAKFRSVSEDDEGLGKSWRMSLGGEYTADPSALESYLKRLTFRLGGTLEQYPFFANGTQVKDYGINFGLSAPAGRSSMDLAVKIGRRGNTADNQIEESYFKIYFGITFNDQWFIKRKFD